MKIIKLDSTMKLRISFDVNRRSETATYQINVFCRDVRKSYAKAKAKIGFYNFLCQISNPVFYLVSIMTNLKHHT